jgi:hypothetical protein
MNELAWQKSSCSSVTGGNCVEVAPLLGGGRAIRDSKAPGAGLLLLPRAVADTAAGSRAFPVSSSALGS